MLIVLGGCTYVVAASPWEISVYTAQFCCELKTALKIKSILKRGEKTPKHQRTVILQKKIHYLSYFIVYHHLEFSFI